VILLMQFYRNLQVSFRLAVFLVGNIEASPLYISLRQEVLFLSQSFVCAQVPLSSLQLILPNENIAFFGNFPIALYHIPKLEVRCEWILSPPLSAILSAFQKTDEILAWILSSGVRWTDVEANNSLHICAILSLPSTVSHRLIKQNVDPFAPNIFGSFMSFYFEITKLMIAVYSLEPLGDTPWELGAIFGSVPFLSSVLAFSPPIPSLHWKGRDLSENFIHVLSSAPISDERVRFLFVLLFF
jgi:hypothetical protein